MRPFVSSKSVTRQIGVQIPGKLHKLVASKCEKENLHLSTVVREFLKSWVKYGKTSKSN